MSRGTERPTRAWEMRPCRGTPNPANRRPIDSVGLRPEQVSVGKYNNVTKAIEICRAARTILGANGISEEFSIMRHANNLESVLTYEGTVEMHALTIGKGLTGVAAFR